jgi:hypothetical protein
LQRIFDPSTNVMSQGTSAANARNPPPSSLSARLARDELQLLFSFLDWRSKLALARRNRTLLGDADSVLAWKDSDGPSAFSPAGVIELNLAVLAEEKNISDAAMTSLAARRGRVRILYRHRTMNEDRCWRLSPPFDHFRRRVFASSAWTWPTVPPLQQTGRMDLPIHLRCAAAAPLG